MVPPNGLSGARAGHHGCKQMPSQGQLASVLDSVSMLLAALVYHFSQSSCRHLLQSLKVRKLHCENSVRVPPTPANRSSIDITTQEEYMMSFNLDLLQYAVDSASD